MALASTNKVVLAPSPRVDFHSGPSELLVAFHQSIRCMFLFSLMDYYHFIWNFSLRWSKDIRAANRIIS